MTLSNDDKILAEEQSNAQKEHASFLEPAIKKICADVKIYLQDIDAFSVINGPGSYTGLRVGLSSAKALCYALNKPLILLNTLDVMAYALKLKSKNEEENVLFCPLIDARRQEVFTALYDHNLNILKNYSSEILDEHFLEAERASKKIILGGSGSMKLQKIVADDNIIYINALSLSEATMIISNKAYAAKDFSPVAYSEPFYLKPVYFRK